MSFENVAAIIPARWASSRFPGKPLALLGGKPVVQRVWERARTVFERCIVATDDERIRAAVEGFGGQAVMTSPDLRSGTDRCREALLKAGLEAEIVVNIQGDEPFVTAGELRALVEQFADGGVDIATLCCPFGAEEIGDPSKVKVVMSKRGRALYFSRSVVPFQRDVERSRWQESHTYYRHLGLYAFRRAALLKVGELEPSSLEVAENLEQLRWLENGMSIGIAVVEEQPGVGIDTPADLERANELLGSNDKL